MEGLKLKKREIKSNEKQHACTLCFPTTYHSTKGALKKHRSIQHREFIKNLKQK